MSFIPRVSRCYLLIGLIISSLLMSACTAPSVWLSRQQLSPSDIITLVNDSSRSSADKTNDLTRKPVEFLNFVGISSGMVILDLSAGGGYTTELLARAVGVQGKVYGQSPPRPPGSPVLPMGRLTSAQSLEERSLRSNLKNIYPVIRAFNDPVPNELQGGKVDLVTLVFNYHDLVHQGIDRDKLNKAVFEALKPGGIYIISDHSAKSGVGISEVKTTHRIEESFLRNEIVNSGFKYVGRGSFLENKDDPRDKNQPDPPQLKDGFILKFIKP